MAGSPGGLAEAAQPVTSRQALAEAAETAERAGGSLKGNARELRAAGRRAISAALDVKREHVGATPELVIDDSYHEHVAEQLGDLGPPYCRAIQAGDLALGEAARLAHLAEGAERAWSARLDAGLTRMAADPDARRSPDGPVSPEFLEDLVRYVLVADVDRLCDGHDWAALSHTPLRKPVPVQVARRALLRIGGKMLSLGEAPEDVRAALHEHNAALGPFSHHEIERIADWLLDRSTA